MYPHLLPRDAQFRHTAARGEAEYQGGIRRIATKDAKQTTNKGKPWDRGLPILRGRMRFNRVLPALICCVFVTAAAGMASLSAAEPIPNSSCMDCHSDESLTKTDAAGREISLFVDEAKIGLSSHKSNSCHSCHSDLTADHPDDGVAAKSVSCTACHEQQSVSYGASVHGLALAKGQKDSATCVDCHGSHEILPPTSINSPLHFSKLMETCGACHDQAARDVAESIHGLAVAKGHREAPTCTDCHQEHKIVGLKTSSPMKISADVCSNCHASERLNTKYNMPRDRVKTFFESYHGLAAQYGSTVAANCSSCHGVHKILPSTNPESTIHKDNLVQTCGKCHPGASANFALSKIHVDPTSLQAGAEIGEKVNWWVRKIYLGLIFVVIGGMVLHNGALFCRKLAARYRAADQSVIRMDRSQRIQHATLAISFIILAITGFALKFPDSWVGKAMGSSEDFRSWSHRIAGIVLLVAGAYHVYYLIFKKQGRRLLLDFMPAKKDVSDVIGSAKYLSGLSTEKPKIGRFGYSEKMEYWAVVWGTVIMGVTGFMIWFKIEVTTFMPRWAVDVATTIHYYEAILACLAIVVWHFYHVIFDPDVYPLNWAAWSGRVSKHWQEEEHPLDGAASQDVMPTPDGVPAEEEPAGKHRH